MAWRIYHGSSMETPKSLLSKSKSNNDDGCGSYARQAKQVGSYRQRAAKKMKHEMIMLAAVALCVAVQAAAPQLEMSAEPIPRAGFKAKLIAKSKKKIQVSPKKQIWGRRMVNRATGAVEKEWQEEHFKAFDIWREHELVGEWNDEKNNAITLANVSALCPEFVDGHAMREDIDKKIAESAESFNDPDDATLAKWAAKFAGGSVAPSALSPFAVGSAIVPVARIVGLGSSSRIASLFKTKDGLWHWVEFRLAQAPRPREGETLMKTFLKSVALDAKARNEAKPPRGRELKGYKFETDLNDSKAAQFIAKANEFLLAMRDAYMRYVPPQNGIPDCKVRLLPTYLKEMAAGRTWDEATRAAWHPVKDRDFVADFLKFWKRRNLARSYEPPAARPR